MPIKIRQAVPTDAKDIKFIHYHAYQVCYRGYLPDDFLDQMPFDDAVIQRTAARIKSVEYYVVELNNHIAGFLCVQVPEARTVEVQMLYIHPDFQRQGLGRALMCEICVLKKKQGFKKLIAWTIKDGPAVGFYEKLGMTKSNTPAKKFGKTDVAIIRLEKPI